MGPLFALLGVAGLPMPPFQSADDSRPLLERAPPPPGFTRVEVPEGSFGAWLRRLPIRAGRPPVHLFDGRLKTNQSVHALVADLDVGSKDLQQCADAVIRLYAEYQYASDRADEVCFRFTSGDAARYRDYRAGLRPEIRGAKVRFRPSAKAASGRATFRTYLDLVFTYAGTRSLARDLKRVPIAEVAPGDVLLQGGSPGHAVLVLDVAKSATGEARVLLGQSYMPAQEFHVLRGPSEDEPWTKVPDAGPFETPEWTFTVGDLHRFVGPPCP